MSDLTKREWKILQQGLLTLRQDVEHNRLDWDHDADGHEPAVAEIDALAEKVGNMPHDGDDEYKGPMKDGKPYVTDYEQVVNAMLLTDMCLDLGDYRVNIPAVEAAVKGWTDDERASAFVWAACSHLAAGDNDDVEVPPTPPHVEKLRPKYGS